MEAIILVGGFGTRLKDLVKDIPKPMALVKGKPFLSYVLEYLSFQGISKVVLCVGYKHEIISEYFGASYRDIQIEYSIETTPLGTGGALKQALEICSESNIFVLNGDTYFPVDLSKLNDFHSKCFSSLTLALKNVGNSDRYGSVILSDENKIAGFSEKTVHSCKLINGGVYVVNRDLFKELNIIQSSFSLEKEVIEKFYFMNKFYGLVFEDYFIDIGIPEDFERAQQELLT